MSLEIAGHGVAGHHTPDDQPAAIAATIAAWPDEHDLRADVEGGPRLRRARARARATGPVQR
ncbi:hypothetical protein [Saccharothrix deserti]|uniref:hypothetical protein n=1 Tax=Saccharothrix deserti TaxID=2593674 RepID=UPI00131A6801|nr:hypothetical protein [Saccharothrix deserti]